MRPLMLRLITVAAFASASGPAFANTDVLSEPEAAVMYECSQADGITLYTNRERPGCQAMTLRPLSIVPPLPDVPDRSSNLGAGAAFQDAPGYRREPAGRAQHEDVVPTWGQDWYAVNHQSRVEICGLYSEWVRLNERTRGGFFFGSDPSYGGDPSGRTFTQPSFSFYDNARYVTLGRLFGSGFVPVGCP